jgi:transcription initiation factor TFIIIB Brf1 subunit/transcription initiation factor TFIIB
VEIKTTAKRAVLRVFPKAGEVKRRLQEPGADRDARLRAQVRKLNARVTELEVEVQEARRLNGRVAELTDVVAQVLLPADQRDDEAIRTRLADYVHTL